MSRTRRSFSAKFKSDLILEVLKGEKELNVIATENDIQPNLLRNWKEEFLEKASVIFDDTREENLKGKLTEERKEKAAYAKKVGQLTMQVDWLKKSEEMLGPDYESKFSPKPPFDDCETGNLFQIQSWNARRSSITCTPIIRPGVPDRWLPS
ncbi:MAG: transposase [Lachnospiraceae bacterium]|nr:transposase [Lachnospiraceae bacterium]